MSSDEELLALLKANEHIPGDAVEHFIADRQIVASKKCTNNLIIFWVYLQWCAKTESVPMPRHVFFKHFKKKFAPASRDKVRRYYVSSIYFTLSPGELEDARKEVKKEHRWRQAKRASDAGRTKRTNAHWAKGIAVIKAKQAARRGTSN